MANIDPMEFRSALGKFATGVTVITCHHNGEDIGMTASSFNSVSLDPALVLWSIDKRAHSLSAFKAAEHFVVHVLGEEQMDLSNKFASRGEDKFAGLDVARGINHAPMLNQYLARFECTTEHLYEGGDHLIVVGRVQAFATGEGKPLLFQGGSYQKLA
ncbi:flavin reductase family protein [Paraferrimonas sp. SM1919]|uniref:flavin reductase family protein n=1 Tax=Paraferrimonas sp. SM1919 TaxID=2662263 RepID=UPI0013D2FFB0|nr:flavin reductase family protein [Paraferrimonas sp. SM1919]